MIQPTPSDIGRRVSYTAHEGDEPQHGEITSFNSAFVFVRYDDDCGAKPTPRHTLSWADGDGTSAPADCAGVGAEPMETDEHRKTRGPAVPEPIHRYACEGVLGAPDADIVWTQQDQQAALDEGWYLDERDGMISEDEDQPFGMPAGSAFRKVRAKASEGSELHIKAMIVDAWGAIAAWEERYREAVGAVSTFAPASEGTAA